MAMAYCVFPVFLGPGLATTTTAAACLREPFLVITLEPIPSLSDHEDQEKRR